MAEQPNTSGFGLMILQEYLASDVVLRRATVNDITQTVRQAIDLGTPTPDTRYTGSGARTTFHGSETYDGFSVVGGETINVTAADRTDPEPPFFPSIRFFDGEPDQGNIINQVGTVGIGTNDPLYNIPWNNQQIRVPNDATYAALSTVEGDTTVEVIKDVTITTSSRNYVTEGAMRFSLTSGRDEVYQGKKYFRQPGHIEISGIPAELTPKTALRMSVNLEGFPKTVFLNPLFLMEVRTIFLFTLNYQHDITDVANVLSQTREHRGIVSQPEVSAGRANFEIIPEILAADAKNTNNWSKDTQRRLYPGDAILDDMAALTSGVDRGFGSVRYQE